MPLADPYTDHRFVDPYPQTPAEHRAEPLAQTYPRVNSDQVLGPEEPLSQPPQQAYTYPPEGRLASALANHFGQGFDINFLDPPKDPPGEELSEEFMEEGRRFGDSYDRQLSRQFGGFDLAPGSGTEGEESPDGRPVGLRGLHWLRKNMSSLRIIVSLQRVPPPEPEAKTRKISGNL